MLFYGTDVEMINGFLRFKQKKHFITTTQPVSSVEFNKP